MTGALMGREGRASDVAGGRRGGGGTESSRGQGLGLRILLLPRVWASSQEHPWDVNWDEGQRHHLLTRPVTVVWV